MAEEKIKEEKPKTKTKEDKPVEKKVAAPKTKPKTQTTKKKTASAKKTTTAKPKKTEEKPKAPAKKAEEKAKAKPESEKEESKSVKDEKEEYVVKKKPELSKEIKASIAKRKEIKKRTPKFLREEWFRYKRIPKNWRRPDGITSKMRINLKYRPSKVRVGFRGPKDVRGLHPSGFQEIMVYNPNDLEAIDPKIQAARIGSTVGTKKRIDIEKKAEELDIRILNK